jgi:hypothetical protein
MEFKAERKGVEQLKSQSVRQKSGMRIKKKLLDALGTEKGGGGALLDEAMQPPALVSIILIISL